MLVKPTDYKTKLLKQITDMRGKADRLETWINALSADGFDWENVTEAQAWAINNYACPPADRKDVKW